MSVTTSDKQTQNINTWVIEIPSIIRATYGTTSTKEGYGGEIVEVDGYMHRDASQTRTQLVGQAQQHVNWVHENMTAVSRVFANWLSCNGYDDVIVSADLHEGRRNSHEHYSWFHHNNVILFKTLGKPHMHDFQDGWLGAPIKITAGVCAGRCAHILVIDHSKKRPYTVIMDGAPMRYKRSQFKLVNRQQVKDIFDDAVDDDVDDGGDDDVDDGGDDAVDVVLMALSTSAGALRVVSHLSKLGNIELPGYAESKKLECAVLADPIFDTPFCAGQDYKKLWTSEVGGTEFKCTSTVTWEPQKPTKAARAAGAAGAAKAAVV